MKKPQYIFIHHTAVSWKKNPDQWQATNAYHKKLWGVESSLGYYGGYNYEVAANGSIKQFRADGEITVSQYQQNMNDGRAISICLDGEFDDELPTEEQKLAVATFLREKMSQYGIPRDNIFPHRHVARKTCPGDNLPDDIASYFLDDAPKPKISDWAIASADKAVKKGIISNWNTPQEILSNQKLKIILNKLSLIKEPNGQLTLEQFAVALDRAGLLD